MNELRASIEKSVTYLRERYPADLPLLMELEKKLECLRAKDKKLANVRSIAEKQRD